MKRRSVSIIAILAVLLASGGGYIAYTRTRGSLQQLNICDILFI